MQLLQTDPRGEGFSCLHGTTTQARQQTSEKAYTLPSSYSQIMSFVHLDVAEFRCANLVPRFNADDCVVYERLIVHPGRIKRSAVFSPVWLLQKRPVLPCSSLMMTMFHLPTTLRRNFVIF
jgi:hypothetical protein